MGGWDLQTDHHTRRGGAARPHPPRKPGTARCGRDPNGSVGEGSDGWSSGPAGRGEEGPGPAAGCGPRGTDSRVRVWRPKGHAGARADTGDAGRGTGRPGGRQLGPGRRGGAGSWVSLHRHSGCHVKDRRTSLNHPDVWPRRRTVAFVGASSEGAATYRAEPDLLHVAHPPTVQRRQQAEPSGAPQRTRCPLVHLPVRCRQGPLGT